MLLGKCSKEDRRALVTSVGAMEERAIEMIGGLQETHQGALIY